MTVYRRGTVVLVRFVFSDETGAKRRPAVVVSSPDYQRARQEVIVAAITSNVQRRLFGDHVVAGWRVAGLLFPSLATSILRTIKRTMIEGRLGLMPDADVNAVDSQMRRSLGL